MPGNKLDHQWIHEILEVIRKKLISTTKSGGMQARKQFKVFDRDASGAITKGEFEKALANWGIVLSSSEMGELFAKFDHDESGELNYDEFVRYVIDHGETSAKIGETVDHVQNAHDSIKLIAESRSKVLHDAFKLLDEDKSGYLDRKELEATASRGGIKLTAKELDILMGLYDKSGDDRVDWAEFSAMMATKGMEKNVQATGIMSGVQNTMTAGQQTAAKRTEALGKAVMSNRQIMLLLKEKVEQMALNGGETAARKVFRKFDPESTGRVPKKAFQQVLSHKWGMKLGDQQLDEIFGMFDKDGNGEDRAHGVVSFLVSLFPHTLLSCRFPGLRGASAEPPQGWPISHAGGS
jgi:Ca2+-binding EF-hand superfamily protein